MNSEIRNNANIPGDGALWVPNECKCSGDILLNATSYFPHVWDHIQEQDRIYVIIIIILKGRSYKYLKLLTSDGC